VEFEEPQNAIALLQQTESSSARFTSSALKLLPTREARQALAAFDDGIYLHRWSCARLMETKLFTDLDDRRWLANP